MKSSERCRSQWRQFEGQPVIRCARRAGHDAAYRDSADPLNDSSVKDWHYNTAEERQWATGNTEDASE